MTWRRRFAIALIVAAGGGALIGSLFAADLQDARRRVASGRSQLIATPHGALEYAIAGDGPTLLMIHGTGGGFDQGLAFAEPIRARGFRILAPSRFGYLRSAFPDDPSSERQADAFVSLLDRLGLGRVAIAGGSAGALSAVQFALRHPERCSALILIVPAANVRGRDPVRMSPTEEYWVRRLLNSDLLFWLALKTVPDRLTGTLLATDPALLETVDGGERRRARRILRDLMPIGDRAKGMLNDAELAGSPARVDFTRVRVPTLVISVEDDRFGTAATARDIAAAVPGARLVVYPSGGHIWLGHDEELADVVASFLRGLQPARGSSR